jgi:hypothetical protein
MRNAIKIENKIRAEAMAKVKCVVVASKDDYTVLAAADNFIDANQELCKILDAYFDAHPEANGHNFDLVPLNRVVDKGRRYTADDVVFIPC